MGLRKLGNGVLFLEDKYEIIWVCLATDDKADFSLNCLEINKKHGDLE